MERLEMALDKALAALGLREASRRHRALPLWEEVVGRDLAVHARAAFLRGSVLEVVVSDSLWANQLAFMKADLLERLNLRLGEAVLSDIRVRVGPLGAPPEGSQSEHLQPEEIRAAEGEARALVEESGPTDHKLREAMVALIATANARSRRRMSR